MAYDSSTKVNPDAQELPRAPLALRTVALQRALGLAVAGLVDVILLRVFENPRSPVGLTESRVLREGDDAIEVTVEARSDDPRSAAFVFTVIKRGQPFVDAEYLRRTSVLARAITSPFAQHTPDFTDDAINGVPGIRFVIER